MRDGPRHAGDRPTSPRWRSTDAADETLARGSARRPPEDAEPDTSERITLIEFLWEGRTGAQQVILVSREWLQ